VGSTLTATGEDGLEIREGRPDTKALLLAAEQGRDGATIGVFVGGARRDWLRGGLAASCQLRTSSECMQWFGC
jgi:hypothetical protein